MMINNPWYIQLVFWSWLKSFTSQKVEWSLQQNKLRKYFINLLQAVANQDKHTKSSSNTSWELYKAPNWITESNEIVLKNVHDWEEQVPLNKIIIFSFEACRLWPGCRLSMTFEKSEESSAFFTFRTILEKSNALFWGWTPLWRTFQRFSFLGFSSLVSNRWAYGTKSMLESVRRRKESFSKKMTQKMRRYLLWNHKIHGWLGLRSTSCNISRSAFRHFCIVQ